MKNLLRRFLIILILAFGIYLIFHYSKWFLIFTWPILLAVVIGTIRLFILGPFVQYENSIKDISILKKGDIILVGKQNVGNSWYIQISNVLSRKIKHRFWTHAALYQGDSKKVWEAQPEGVIETDIKSYLDGGYIIRAFRHREIKDEKAFDQAIEFCRQQDGCRYGWTALGFYVFSTFTPVSFNFIFDNPIVYYLCDLEKAYFCSELIVDAFENAGYPVTAFDGWRVKPSDFISNPILDEVSP